ncbi:MAG: MotA/TolQ/ExbB proton channel family protein [Planctomycetota bacterium]
MARHGITMLLCGAALAFARGPAQESAADLGAEVERLEREVRDLTAELERDAAREAAELEARRAERSALAGRILEARLAADAAAERLVPLQASLSAARLDAEGARDAAQTLASAGAAAAERLAVAIGDLPGQSARIDALVAAGAALAAPSDGVPSEDTAGALIDVAGIIGGTLEDARSVRARSIELHGAEGELESVQLLEVGLAQFAYVSDDDVAVALGSAPDAAGYRWATSLPDDADEGVRAAVDALRAGDAGDVLSVPVDPTGRLRVETASEPASWRDRVASGGPVMLPLAVVALLALLLIMERIAFLYGANWRRDAVAARVLEASKSASDEPLRLGRFGGGSVGRVMNACLRRRDGGQRAMEDGIQEQLLHETPRLERSMGGLAVLAAVAPLLGLLGTVAGIIETFGVLQAFGGGEPALMAGGVSEALVTTATGLVIAVPTLVVRSLLRGRADRILADSERHAATLLMNLAHGEAR